MAVLVVPIPSESQAPVAPVRVWSVGPLAAGRPVSNVAFGPKGATFSDPHIDTQTRSIFSATRTVAFAADRIIAVIETGMRLAEGSQAPISTFELLSMDVKTGQVKDQREFEAFASLPIFATADEHIIVAGRKVYRLDPQLKDAGVFDYESTGHKFGSVQNISPDGSMLGNATSPGFDLIDARTLTPRQLTKDPSVDTSVNSHGFVTDNVHWIRDFPKDISFVTYVDGQGQHLLYHGKCGGRPQFITNDVMLEPGCKQAFLINTQGQVVQILDLKGAFSFAGSSQNGERFALQLGSFDSLHDLNKERFEILSSKDGHKIAEIEPDSRADEQSWTAFSADGTLFAVGSAQKLSLWRLP
jgi:hypothetical protein